MTDEEIYQLAMARLAADRDFQLASFWYLVSVVLVILLGASFLTARVYAMRSSRNLRQHVGVYAPDWRPGP
jgi:hypothetical protein